jgi:Tol biopolymer transport system component
MTTIGQRLAHYEITGHLGSGGMGDVYQATDSKLGRGVAIKLLPDALAHDIERVARFQREARVLASLNHPNIAAIYGLEQAGQQNFLVLELIDGETLAERIRRGPIPVDDAIRIAMQIADALEAAHEREKAIIHRDLKPANVMITHDGKVKVLDFGLAKAYAVDPAHADLSTSPTSIGIGATMAGMILGTATYMSPEQAKGRAVDRRSDIFAFGSVLYEMLTGRPAFEGEEWTEILGRIVTVDPDWTRLPAATPSALHRLLRRALKKDPHQRLADIHDARLELEDALTEPASATRSVAPARQARLPWAVAALCALAAMIVGAVALRPAPTPAEIRLEIQTPATFAPSEAAISPDGRLIVFVASGDGPQRLWVRALDKVESRPLPGTDGADYPFWSPDSRSVGFFATGKLYRIDVSGGAPQALANAPLGFGGSWSGDGTILFALLFNGPLSRVAASGGDAAIVTHVNPPQQIAHRFPYFLPDSRHFLFYVVGNPDTSGIYVGSLDGGNPKRLTSADSPAAYLAPDLIVFVRQQTLVAWHLDLKRGELTGNPITVGEVAGSSVNNAAGISVSSDGRIAYRAGGPGLRHMVWYDRSGKMLGPASETDDSIVNPELSPDNRSIVFQRNVQSNTDVWIKDVMRAGLTRLTFDAASDSFPVWSPDGTRVVFNSNRTGKYDLYQKPANGSGADQVLLDTPNLKLPQDWSRDGRFLLYFEIFPKTGRDLMALPMPTATSADRTPVVVANTPYDERGGQFSPDGRWVVYETNESGRSEIVVQSFPAPIGKWQMSTNGGVQPRWRPDGKELYFIGLDGKLMATPIEASTSTLVAGTPVALFPSRIVGGSFAVLKPQYAVSRDGRFLINQLTDQSGPPPITLILNWKPPA